MKAKKTGRRWGLAVLYLGGTMTNSRVALVGLGVAAASLLVSCSSTFPTSSCGSIQASDYDQSCSTAADCVAVAEGDSCKGLFCVDCPNAAINVSAQGEYERALQGIKGTTVGCPCPSNPPGVSNVICDAGVCRFN